MCDYNLRDKSRTFWKALEYISKLKESERMELCKLLVTVDHGKAESETTYYTVNRLEIIGDKDEQ